MRKGTKKRMKEKEKCEKGRNCSGVGIQTNTIIIIRCNNYSLMKQESAGEHYPFGPNSLASILFFSFSIRNCNIAEK